MIEPVPSAELDIEAFDVAVVGFGPSGAVAAALLGRAGLRVLVIDKSTAVYDKPRALALDHEVMRVLQGLGVAQAVLAHTAPFTASEHFGVDGQMIRRLTMLPPPYPMGWTPSMVFSQPAVEGILRAAVAALPTVTVRLGHELVGLSQDASGRANVDVDVDIDVGTEKATDSGTVRLSLCAPDGAVQVAQARYVIGCDGASSSVRRWAGLVLDDLDFDEPWLVVDVLANESGLAKLPPTSAQFCEPTRPCSYLVGTGAHRRWEIMLLPGEDPAHMVQDDQVWALLARWLTPAHGVLWRRASYRFHALVARDWRAGRVFIAGDAAHQQPPFLGQGMCQGIRDVSNLAWKLQEVIRGRAVDSLLDSYGVERGTHVRALTATIKAIGRSICERDPVVARARDARLLVEQGGQVQSVPRQDLIPGLAAGFLGAGTHRLKGRLFVQPLVRQGAQTVLLDDACGGGWRVVLGDAAHDWDAPELPRDFRLLRVHSRLLDNRLPNTHGQACVVWAETEGVLKAWFALHACAAVIVRPDHYVYAACTDTRELRAELITLNAYLEPPHEPHF